MSNSLTTEVGINSKYIITEPTNLNLGTQYIYIGKYKLNVDGINNQIAVRYNGGIPYDIYGFQTLPKIKQDNIMMYHFKMAELFERMKKHQITKTERNNYFIIGYSSQGESVGQIKFVKL